MVHHRGTEDTEIFMDILCALRVSVVKRAGLPLPEGGDCGKIRRLGLSVRAEPHTILH
jgi:hypothetical protein